jgi:hypothetical protein
MEGYSTLRSRVTAFLRQNPDVQTITLKRPKTPMKVAYTSGRQECYGRIPETCPVVQAILSEQLFDGLRVLRPDGSEVDLERLRMTIFQKIHDQVTVPFRNALEEVCEQKHRVIGSMRVHQREVNRWIDSAETEIPEDQQPRARSRRGTDSEVEVEVEDEDL